MKAKEIILDFTGCRYIVEFYNIIINAFDFPEWCGCNIDALWDMLREPRENYVIIKGIKTMPQDLQEYFHKVHIILDRTWYHQARWGLYFDYKIID